MRDFLKDEFPAHSRCDCEAGSKACAVQQTKFGEGSRLSAQPAASQSCNTFNPKLLKDEKSCIFMHFHFSFGP
jgi:hypothetical protein